jgi:nucleoside-diphosphate-sugar epimerase
MTRNHKLFFDRFTAIVLATITASLLTQQLTCAFLPSQYPQIRTTRTSSITSSGIKSESSSVLLFATKYQKVFVAGGSRGVGRCIIDQLLEQNREVVALVRDENDCTTLNAIDGVTAILGNAFTIKDVENAMDGCDAAITTLGGSTTDTGSRIDYEGNNNVIESAGILGVTRVILVTSIGCGTSKEAAPPAVFEALKEVLQAKEKAENILIKYYTNTNWTIIRPGGLKSEPATTNAVLTEDATAIGSIHREDVAALVVQALDSSSSVRKILSAVDPSITSAVNVEGKQVAAFAL